MDIQNLVPVDYSNQRVLTTAQVAEVFGTSPARIRDNFKHAKKQFQEGVHYFKVEGDELRAMRERAVCALKSYAPSPFPKGGNAVILYTAQGCARHCKMLNTPQAWEMMDKLKIEYFAVEDAEKPAMTPQVFNHPQFGNLRIVIINGEVWFVGKDVAEGLGYKDTVNALKQHVDDADKLGWQITTSGQRREVTIINKSGVYSLILDSQLPKAKEYRHWVMEEVAKACEKSLLPLATPQVFDKVGYIDDKGTAWFNAEFVARGLGFVQVKNDRVPNYGDKLNLFGNDNYINDNYTVVRWERVNSYLREFGFDKEVAKDDFLPENIVYRLAMKANNETAVQFQIQIANEILPSIRKHGYYSVNEPVETSLFPDDESVKAKKKRRPLPEYAVVYAALLDNALVKIGLTCDFNRRIKEVRKETGLDVEEVFTTDFMPLDDARKLEAAVKAKFHEKNKGGELYDAPFEQVKTAIRDAPNDAFNQLLALAEKISNPDEKDKLLIKAANLLK